MDERRTMGQNEEPPVWTAYFQMERMLREVSDGSMNIPTNTGENMTNKFKVGDRVKGIGSQGFGDHDRAVGIEGRVHGVAPDSVSIRWDNNTRGLASSTYYSNDRKRPIEECLELLKEDVQGQEPGAGKTEKKTIVNFDSVIISDDKRQQILEALEQINQQELIFQKWGFEETIEKGRGVSILFYGPPGTGKTLMAQAIAHKLERPLRIIATADVESSIPGEAERNIRKHFTDAQKDKAILLFDECDSLIFSRESVGPIMAAQTNELLSQIERFNGITVFTTNRLGTLDDAVNRRIILKLKFDMPSAAERVEIWKRMFPKKAPLEKNIDWATLASVEITGGYIKNAVLRAARMAAVEDKTDRRKKITMAHLKASLVYEARAMQEFDKARDEHRSRGLTVAAPGKGRSIVKQEAGL